VALDHVLGSEGADVVVHPRLESRAGVLPENDFCRHIHGSTLLALLLLCCWFHLLTALASLAGLVISLVDLFVTSGA